MATRNGRRAPGGSPGGIRDAQQPVQQQMFGFNGQEVEQQTFSFWGPPPPPWTVAIGGAVATDGTVATGGIVAVGDGLGTRGAGSPGRVRGDDPMALTWPLDGGAPESDFVRSLQEAESIEALARLARDCRQCNLRNGCRGVVFGEGDPTATIMFVGEGPGQNEDELGRPFVGRAGQLLDKWLAAIGLKRAEVYITNVVKCRPPGNRTPTPEEARLCWPILRTQLRLIRPRILVCLGSPAVQALVHPSARITRMRGNWLERGNMKLLGTFHPAAVLRDLTKERAVEEDLRKLQAECARLGGSTQEGSGR